MSQKISLSLRPPENLSFEESRNWYRARNFIVRPIVLITTVNNEGTPNSSVKTNFMTASSMKNFAFCCSPEHHTYQNIMATREFVINVPTEDIADKVFKAAIITEKPSPAGWNEIESRLVSAHLDLDRRDEDAKKGCFHSSYLKMISRRQPKLYSLIADH